MNEYWKMMTGSGSKSGYFKKKAEEKEEPKKPEAHELTTLPNAPQSAPPSRLPVPRPILGPVRRYDATQDMIDHIDEGVLDGRALQRLQEAAKTGETIVEMREVVARSGGTIKARSMEVSLTFGEKLSLGELLKGALSIFDYTRNATRRAIGRSVPLPPETEPPVRDIPFTVLPPEAPRHKLGHRKA